MMSISRWILIPQLSQDCKAINKICVVKFHKRSWIERTGTENVENTAGGLSLKVLNTEKLLYREETYDSCAVEIAL